MLLGAAAQLIAAVDILFSFKLLGYFLRFRPDYFLISVFFVSIVQ